MKGDYSVEKMYQHTLGLLALKEEDMHPIQRLQLRQMFFAAAGEMLVMLRNDIGAENEEDGITALEKLDKEVKDYWDKQVKEHGGNI